MSLGPHLLGDDGLARTGQWTLQYSVLLLTVLAETQKVAKSVVEGFMSLDANILVQEFIKEANGADIRAFVVDGQIVGAMKRQGADGEFRSNLHRGGKATVIKLTPEEKATALKSAKNIN